MSQIGLSKRLFDPSLNPSARAVDALAARLDLLTRPRPLRLKLELAFQSAMCNRPAGRTGLRLLVRDTIRRGHEIGEPTAIVGEVLLDFLMNHPRRDELDRVSVVDGSRSSERILAQVRHWIDDP